MLYRFCRLYQTQAPDYLVAVYRLVLGERVTTYASVTFLEGLEAALKAALHRQLDCSYFLRLRSQMSAAIDPTKPIAASPEKASISGTGFVAAA